jgi:predicted ATPase
MINNITIKNYKSVVNVNLPLGRFNLLIGANGCGKSNILEGIALGAAASSFKLEYEYFANRGIRITEPKFMLPAFEGIHSSEIFIKVSNDNRNLKYNIFYNNDLKPAGWNISSIDPDILITYLKLKIERSNGNPDPKLESKKIAEKLNLNNYLAQFLIYSPEESKLRQADNSNRTYPLGLHGEGLFAYLKEISQRPNNTEFFNEIKENLKVLDWFDDMQVPSGQLSMEFILKLKDSYLPELYSFDQRSTNEGFLYLLFYLTLIISDESPKFFAIENIDTAFNPKLCREVTRRLIELANKHNKQIIATTHNAAVLDGMDIRDDNVRLHVVRRTIDGHTNTNRVMLKDNMKMSLSEAWLKGLIGGLPDNF